MWVTVINSAFFIAVKMLRTLSNETLGRKWRVQFMFVLPFDAFSIDHEMAHVEMRIDKRRNVPKREQ